MRFINLLSISLFVFILGSLSSCLKKGEDDPLISFRTRKAKLSGKWQLTSGTEEHTSVYSDSLGKQESKTTLVYTKNTYKTVTEASGYQSSSSGPFSYSMEFKKDGGYNSTKVNDKIIVFASEGLWNFTKGVGDYKNKEQIVINLTSNSTTFSDPQYPFMFGNTFSGNQSDITYTLKELRNKKLVLVSERSDSYSNGNVSSSKSELTFEQE
jgi:hypothetical protein